MYPLTPDLAKAHISELRRQACFFRINRRRSS
jgi:hypothetical protein